MSFACHLYALVFYLYVLVCHSYVTRMCSYVLVCHPYVLICTRMSLVCTHMSSVCHSYVLVCHLHVTRMYSYIIRMSLVCSRTSSVCHSYVLVYHSYVTLLWFCHEPSSIMKNNSHKHMLNKRGPKSDPWGTPNKFLPMSCMLKLFWFFVCDLSNSLQSILMSQYWIPKHLILQLRGHERGSQVPWKDP